MGSTFDWREACDSSKKGSTQWKDFMINYRAADLEALVEELKKRRCNN